MDKRAAYKLKAGDVVLYDGLERTVIENLRYDRSVTLKSTFDFEVVRWANVKMVKPSAPFDKFESGRRCTKCVPPRMLRTCIDVRWHELVLHGGVR